MIERDMENKENVPGGVLMSMGDRRSADWVPSKSWKGESVDKAQVGTVC